MTLIKTLFQTKLALRNQLFFPVAAILTILLFANYKPHENLRASTNDRSLLAQYGERVYMREGCAHCHTLNIDEAGPEMVSLDGLGGKYPDSWFYNYLHEPRLMVPQSVAPAYPYLFDNKLDKNMFKIIFKDNNPGLRVSKMNASWEELYVQADDLTRVLKEQRISTPSRTEGLALIAYLQQIPSSKGKLRRDSIESAAEMEKWKAWDDLILDDNSIIIKTAGEPNSAGKGEILFKANCAACHGRYGQGMIGPNLTDDYWLHGSIDTDIARTIVNGYPEKGMIAWRYHLSPKEVGEVLAYIKSIRGSNPENQKAPQGVKE